jgi:hypothetical protein
VDKSPLRYLYSKRDESASKQIFILEPCALSTVAPAEYADKAFLSRPKKEATGKELFSSPFGNP